MNAREEWNLIERMMVGDFNPDPDFIQDPKTGKFRGSRSHGTRRISHDVTDEYNKNSTPEVGNITKEPNYKPSDDGGEEEFADTLRSVFGGDIILLTKIEDDGVETPDYRWRGKFWELKGCTSLNSVSKRLRKGLSQIRKDPGGVILNCKGGFAPLERIEQEINGRLIRSSGLGIDVIIAMDGKIVKVLRENKNPQANSGPTSS